MSGYSPHYESDEFNEGPIISQGIENVDYSYYPQDLTANAIFTNVLTVALLLFFFTLNLHRNFSAYIVERNKILSLQE